VNYDWHIFKAAIPLIVHGDPFLLSIVGFTLQVAAIATALATVIGVPIGLAIGLGRFRGRTTLQFLANASLGLPPALAGVVLYLVLSRQGPLGSLQILLTKRAVFLAQTILALPYTVALTAAAIQGLRPGLLSQARMLGASRLQTSILALREARVGVMAGIIAALGSALSEVAAIAIVGGNTYGYDQTLASSTLFEVNGGYYSQAVAIAIVLIAMILILMCGLGLLQHQSGGLRLSFRPAT
jgi:tungstate transport system permease protein